MLFMSRFNSSLKIHGQIMATSCDLIRGRGFGPAAIGVPRGRGSGHTGGGTGQD